LLTVQQAEARLDQRLIDLSLRRCRESSFNDVLMNARINRQGMNRRSFACGGLPG